MTVNPGILFCMQKVVVRFPKFSVEGIPGCSFDSVQIDGHPLLCGTGPNCTGNFPTKDFVSQGQGDQMNVTFRTDNSVVFPGFTAEYKLVGMSLFHFFSHNNQIPSGQPINQR